MGRGHRAFVAAIVVSGSSACSLITLDGLVGPKDGGASDGGDAGLDALVDVVSSDSGVSDAQLDALVDAGSWCAVNAKAAFFCDDFDSDGFARVSVKESLGGTIKLVTGDALSAPNAVLADCPPVTSSDSQSAQGNLIPGVKTAGGTLSLWVRVDKMNAVSGRTIEILTVVFRLSTGASTEVGLGLRTDRRPYAFRYQTNPSLYATLGVGTTEVPVGPWVRVVLTIDGASGKATATINDAPVITDVSYDVFPAGDVALGIGAYAMPNHDGWKLRYDNVVFDPLK